MDKKIKIAELLIPAGDMEKLEVAFAYGADAVYAGVPAFSLRTREIGFRANSIEAAVNRSHELGKKIYLAMNIYAHNLKLNAFIEEMERVADLKPDAFILTDPGLIQEAVKRFPHIPVHLSTQSNTTNWLTVKFWRDLGVKRIILSRELQLTEIKKMHEEVPDIELEAFVHGAICIAYSGRCLISNYLNHRDANQGTCTNSCRWEYKLAYEKGSILEVEKQQNPIKDEEYIAPEKDYFLKEAYRPNDKFPITEDEFGTFLMNSKDLCSIELLSEILDSGVISLKAEGRTKSAYYAAMVSRSYRKSLDDYYAGKDFDPQNLRDLMALSSRTYTSGFYTRNPRQYGENYDDGFSASHTHRVVATLKGYDSEKKLARILVKNRILPGMKVDVLMPKETRRIIINDIFDKYNNKKEAAHGGAGEVFIPLDFNPGTHAFFREEINELKVESL